MNEMLIKNWNDVVSPEDTIYHMGDVCFGQPYDAKKLLSRLMGNICLIKGNHDKKHMMEICGDRFTWIKDYAEIEFNKQKIILCHFPFMVWNGSHRGTWHLHGHSHGNLPMSPNARRLDVGVDCNDYKLFSFDDIKSIMSKKVFEPIDHHGAD
jgi:calcineurin-like phosphoesterase family protein